MRNELENAGLSEVAELLTVKPDSSARARVSESVSRRIRSLALESMNRKTKPPGFAWDARKSRDTRRWIATDNQAKSETKTNLRLRRQPWRM